MSTAQHTLTILAVKNLQESKTFYSSVFLWEISIDEPVYVQFVLPRGLAIGLYTREGFSSNTHEKVVSCEQPDTTTGTELYLQSVDVEDVIARLVKQQARVLAPLEEKPWGDEVAYFADPDGNVLAIARSQTEQ